MLKHIELNRLSELRPEHFDRWLKLWTETVNENFEGELATQAQSKTRQIASVMQFKNGSL